MRGEAALSKSEDYDEEEADVVDGDCDDEPLTLGVFNLMPDVNAPVPGLLPCRRFPISIQWYVSLYLMVWILPCWTVVGALCCCLQMCRCFMLLFADVSRYQMMAMDPSIAKAQLHSTVCPKTDATEKSLLKSTFAFFFEAHLKGVYADGITVPLCYKGLLRELLVDVSADIQDITHRLYVWVNERAADLCVLFCAYAARKYARNSKAKGEDGLGLKFPPKSFVHRFNCIAHQLFLHHQSLDRQGRAVPSFVRPQFLDAKHRVWGQLWNTVDGASKLAAQAGEFRIKELYSLTRNSFAEYTDPKDAESRVMYKLDPLACKNWNGGLKDAGRPPPCKFSVPNPDYVATGDSYADAKGCNNLGREQLVAALPAQLDAQGWNVQQYWLAPNQYWLAPNQYWLATNQYRLAPNQYWLATNQYWLAPNRYWLAPNQYWLAPNQYWLAPNQYWLAPNQYWLAPNQYWLAPNQYWLAPNKYWLAPNQYWLAPNQYWLAPNQYWLTA
ncbi:hypothetical protein QJQ45_024894 [Haematococcus lacustris]|nr:hypothetical protein QJQ45_024894 [Haematococcus lacustris]